ncbi:MAG TPA: hypothetical protein VF251_09655 [Pyrinomonadaceae bacterium]
MTLPTGSIRGGGSGGGADLSANVDLICGGEAISRCILSSLVQNRIIRPTQPNKVATLKSTIQTIAAGCNPLSAKFVEAPNMIAKPIMTVSASTMLGSVRLIGAEDV